MCLFPKEIWNKRYFANERNGGKPPPLPLNKDGEPDERLLKVRISCGVCIECKKQKARNWKVRLMEECKSWKTEEMNFVTLTYNTESLKKLTEHKNAQGLEGYDLDRAVCSISIKYWREAYRKKYQKSPRFWLINELGHGEFEHVHLHGFIFGEAAKTISQTWKYGNVWESRTHKDKRGNPAGYVSARTINYVMKYVTKTDEEHPNFNQKIWCSNGIGKRYLESNQFYNNRYVGEYTKNTYRLNNGKETELPIYYKNHRYSQDERIKLWQQALDEDATYILGSKIQLSNKENLTTELQKAREFNKFMGYLDPRELEATREQENQRRKDILEERFQDFKNDIEYLW